MKKSLFILFALTAVLFSSCTKEEERWGDNPDSSIYLPQYGLTSNTIWNVESGVYDAKLCVYCSGIRPGNRKDDITVGYAIDQSIIDAYNADITQEFSGSLEALPSELYTVEGTTATIPAGDVAGYITIKFNAAKIAAANLDPAKKWGVPVKLTSTSSSALSQTDGFTEAIYTVTVDTPRFYFYCNAIGTTLNSKKVITSESVNVDRYQIAAFGVPDGEYPISVKYDPEAAAVVYPGQNVLPEDAFTLSTEDMVYKNDHTRAVLRIDYDPSKIKFLTEYYLPITIVSGGAYQADADKKTLFVKVELKNQYEKTYSSKIIVSASATGRSGGYSAKKSPTSYDSDMIEMQLACNNTIAGAKNTATSSTTYNNKYMRVRIIPTSDITRYNVEIVPVTDKTKKNNSPTGLELDPEGDSYYDADQERFVLQYRWQHIEKKDTSWINVTEYVQAN